MEPIRPKNRNFYPPRNGRRGISKKKSKKFPFGLVLVFVVLVLGYWFLQRPKPASPSLSVAAKTSSNEPRIITENSQLVREQKESENRSLLLVQERSAGLKPVPIVASAGSLELNLSTRAFERKCVFGDLDIMARDQKILGKKGSSFVLSLENLEEGESSQKVQVSLEQLQAGFSHKFTIPVKNKRELLGLFLCSSDGSGRCQDREKTSLSKLSALQSESLNHKPGALPYPTQDKVFFFHFLVAYPDRLLLQNSMQSLDSSFDRLNQALDKGDGKPVSPELLSHVKTWAQSIGSLPALVHGQSLEIQLPHQGAHCK